MRVLVVIPAYNEEESIVRVVENLKQNYEQLDYVIINDGSKDHTAQRSRLRFVCWGVFCSPALFILQRAKKSQIPPAG